MAGASSGQVEENRIRLLPENIVNKLAAGEVIQSPMHVVKELIENALDALAREIHIRLEKGGRSLICVEDDGHGMSPIDARMCFERHATSKIRSEEDLMRIETLGFRGEALAAIARVSHVVLETRRSVDERGTRVVMHGGRFIRQEPCIRSVGTRVCVTHLFFNYPARKKAMRSARQELQRCLRVVQVWSLVRPDVGFRVFHDRKPVLLMAPGSREKRLLDFVGGRFSGQKLVFEESADRVHVQGLFLLDTPLRLGVLIVNGRPVQDSQMQSLVRRVLGSLAGELMGYVLEVRVPVSWVDPNVHPAKEEIRFADPAMVYAIIESLLKKGVARSMLGTPLVMKGDGEGLPDVREVERERWSGEVSEGKASGGLGGRGGSSSSVVGEGQLVQLAGRGGEEVGDEKETRILSQSGGGSWLVGGVVSENTVGRGGASDLEASLSGSSLPLEVSSRRRGDAVFLWHPPFLVTTIHSGLLVVHLPNALYRIHYERFVRRLETGEVPTVQSVLAQPVVLPGSLQPFIPQVVEVLNRLGFQVRQAGKDMVVVEGVPRGFPLEGSRLTGWLIRCAQDLVGQDASKIATVAAQRIVQEMPLDRLPDSVRFHQVLQQLFACEDPVKTPDGLPILFTLPYEYMEAFFRGRRKHVRGVVQFQSA